MGSKPIPHYANIVMAHIDKLIKNQEGAKAIAFMKRFLDDFLCSLLEPLKLSMHYLPK